MDRIRGSVCGQSISQPGGTLSTRLMARRIGVAAAGVAAVSLLAPTAAYADGSKRVKFDVQAKLAHGDPYSSRAKGKAWFYDGLIGDRAGWDIYVYDRSKTGRWCGKVKVVADLPAQVDVQYNGPRVCGYNKSKHWVVNKTTAWTLIRGLKIQLCEIEPVSQANQKCVTKKYVKNPYY
ncbi:hypothetical protein [Actinomadura nitritigenes]|uniref:hypothetical protein n=1 Tax=Actinomadura nitritigenes TaxID=134602 RepID=UPI0031DD78CD